MKVLAIETTGNLADLAIMDEEGVTATLAFRHRMELSRLLIPRLQQLLSIAGLEAVDLDGIAVSLGPGSFTGIRIGVATAKALALALDRPIAGVPTLQSIAAEAAAPCGTLVCALIESRAGELYAGLYRSTRDLPVRCAEMLLPVAELEAELAAYGDTIRLTGDTAPYRERLASRFGEEALVGSGSARPRAEVVARLGRARMLAGDGDDRMTLSPRYVRPSAAEARWKETPCTA